MSKMFYETARFHCTNRKTVKHDTVRYHYRWLSILGKPRECETRCWRQRLLYYVSRLISQICFVRYIFQSLSLSEYLNYQIRRNISLQSSSWVIFSFLASVNTKRLPVAASLVFTSVLSVYTFRRGKVERSRVAALMIFLIRLTILSEKSLSFNFTRVVPLRNYAYVDQELCAWLAHPTEHVPRGGVPRRAGGEDMNGRIKTI